tara:strand:+ start:180 stop:1514 length:1335 start_codon:yes stop_codon:yes gene_type:complete
VALREALRESLPFRKQELEALEVEELAPYVQELCTPIREAGLWPDQGFVDLCRERLAYFSNKAQREHDLSLVLFEHEVFYRVEPEPCWLGTFSLGLLMCSAPRDVNKRSILVRSRIRYGTPNGGFRLGVSDGPGPRSFATHPEPGGRLEAAYQWWEKHRLRAGPSRLGARSAAQADLEALLQRGVDDLHPGLVLKLFELLLGHLSRRPPGEAAPTTQEVARLTKLAWREFERALTWLPRLPNEFVEDQVALSTDLAARPWLFLSEEAVGRRAALKNYARALRRIREFILEAKNNAEEVRLGEGLAKTLGALGRTALKHPTLEAFELLKGGEEEMRGVQRASAQFFYFWGALLTAYRKQGQNARALEWIEELGLAETTGVHLLAVPVAEALLEDERGALAIPSLERAHAHVSSQEAAGKLLPGERAGIVGRLRELLAACRAQEAR